MLLAAVCFGLHGKAVASAAMITNWWGAVIQHYPATMQGIGLPGIVADLLRGLVVHQYGRMRLMRFIRMHAIKCSLTATLDDVKLALQADPSIDTNQAFVAALRLKLLDIEFMKLMGISVVANDEKGAFLIDPRADYCPEAVLRIKLWSSSGAAGNVKDSDVLKAK